MFARKFLTVSLGLGIHSFDEISVDHFWECTTIILILHHFEKNVEKVGGGECVCGGRGYIAMF
jgi:hypothetical protein